MNVDVQEVQVQVSKEVNKKRYLLLLYLIFIVLPVMISGQSFILPSLRLEGTSKWLFMEVTKFSAHLIGDKLCEGNVCAQPDIGKQYKAAVTTGSISMFDRPLDTLWFSVLSSSHFVRSLQAV